MTLADHLTLRQQETGLTKKDIAHQIGVNQWTVLGWMNYGRTPRISYWPAIIAFLGYDPICEQPEIVADQTAAVRRRKGWSFDALSQRLSVDPGTLSKWEMAQTRPYKCIAPQIERSLQDLLGEPR